MKLELDLANRDAIHNTYTDCRKWRAKGGVLRFATPPDYKPFNPTSLLPKRKWNNILELGCGLERWMAEMIKLARPSATVYAYDISEDVLRFFSREFAAIKGPETLRHFCVIGDGEALPFCDDFFDGISAVFVGHHMSDAEGFVRGLCRILKPDGWLLTNALDWNFPAPNFPSQALEELMKEPSFFIVKNAFEESRARTALNRYFANVREHKAPIPAELRFTEQLIKLHSRLEEFIRPVLEPHNHDWSTYLAHVERIVEAYLQRQMTFQCSLPITYFLADCPRDVIRKRPTLDVTNRQRFL